MNLLTCRVNRQGPFCLLELRLATELAHLPRKAAGAVFLARFSAVGLVGQVRPVGLFSTPNQPSAFNNLQRSFSDFISALQPQAICVHLCSHLCKSVFCYIPRAETTVKSTSSLSATLRLNFISSLWTFMPSGEDSIAVKIFNNSGMVTFSRWTVRNVWR